MNNGVANVPVAQTNVLGAVKAPGTYGVSVFGGGSAGTLALNPASGDQIKAGNSSYNPITPVNTAPTTFYGLAKAAGADMASSSNAVGNYTPEAKAAIWNMLGLDGSSFIKSDWELIREDTVTNTTEADIEITVDGNGNAFELTDIRIKMIAPQQETVFSQGTFGRITVGCSDNTSQYLYFGEWSNSANASPKIAYGTIEQFGNMGQKYWVRPTTSGIDNTALLTRSNITDGADMWFFGEKIFNKITIASITGTVKYRLYGKRKRAALNSAVINVSGSTPSITALPGHQYICSEVSTLAVSVPASGCIDVRFESGSTATILTVMPPTGKTMKWANGFDPTALNANTVYEINILDGEYGVACTWT